MNFDAIIFDLDGTLLDSLEDLANAVNATMAQYGFLQLSLEEVKTLIGYGARQLVYGAIDFTKPDVSPEKLEEIFQTYREIYARGWQIKTHYYDGVQELIADLRQAGVRLAVLSNKPHDRTCEMVDFYFPHDTFSAVYGQIEPWPVKPDPSLAMEICRQLQAEPARTALVGDSGSDMQTAVRGGLVGLGAAWGFRSAEELQAQGAAEVFATARDLHTWLKRG
jgi:phosphoglycolate phosphatase